MIFEDTFDGDMLDDQKWTTYRPCGSGGGDDCARSRLKDSAGNGNDGIIRDENVYVDNGTCKLFISEGGPANSWYGVERNYNVGTLHCNSSMSFGRLEADIDCPDFPSYWEAFWLWHHDEIDIMEFANSEKFQTNIYKNTKEGYDCDNSFRNETNVLSGFHNYAMELTPFKISFYLDHAEVPYHEMFRYYDEAMNPMDFDCGDTIPEGVYMINPNFPNLYRRWYYPRFDNTVAVGHPEVPYNMANSIMEVDNVKMIDKSIDVCGSLQYEVVNEVCSFLRQCFKILPVGDNTNFINVVSSTSTPNIEYDITLSPWNQTKGEICFLKKDLNAGSITLNILDECDNPKTITIPIPVTEQNCECNARFVENATIENINYNYSTITIAENVELTLKNSTISLYDDGKISLLPGAALILDNTTVTSCNDHWAGIVSDGTADRVELLNGSIVENATFGIGLNTSRDPISWPNWSGVKHTQLIMDNSIIRNCSKGVVFHHGESSSEIRNGSTIENCDLAIDYFNHHGLSIDQTSFIDNEEAIHVVDAQLYLKGGNEFHGGEYGISVEGTLPMAAGLSIGDMDEDHNLFSGISEHAIQCVGAEHPVGATIVNCRFENTLTSTNFLGANQFLFANNSLTNTAVGVFSSGTGDNFNGVQCNELTDVSNQGIIFEADNSRSQFLENHFLGTQHVNTNVWYATVKEDMGSADNPAANCFADNGIDLVAEESSIFDYHYYDDADEDACQEPFNEGTYEKKQSFDIGDHCGGAIGPFNLIDPDDDGFVGIDPPVESFADDITITDLIDKINVGIDQLVAAGGDDPRTYAIERIGDPSPLRYALDERLDQWIRYGLYRALQERDYSLAENILSPLLQWRWQTRLFSLEMIQGDYSTAQQVLNDLPANRTAEVYFKEVQQINLKRFVPTAQLSTITPAELDYLQLVGSTTYPAAGYARSLYRQLTGILLPVTIPALDGQQPPTPRLSNSSVQEGLLIYPNPAKEELIIQFVGSESNQVKLFDGKGRLVKKQYFEGERVRLTLDDLQIGLYIIQINDVEGVFYSGKFVKE